MRPFYLCCLTLSTVIVTVFSCQSVRAEPEVRALVRKAMALSQGADEAKWLEVSAKIAKSKSINVKTLVTELEYCFANPDFEAKPGLSEIALADAKPLQVHVPKNYSPKKAWPLMILLHGTNGTGKGTLETALSVLEKENWILVAPSLKKPSIGNAMKTAGSTGFGWGDHRQCLALKSYQAAVKHFRIDTNRVYLLGVSLGGYGAWSAGTAFWDHWAAVLPYAGGIDYRENNKLTAGLIPKGGIPDGYAPKGLGAQSGKGRRRDLLVNVFNAPFFFVHGAKDTIVEALGDRRSAEELKKLGFKKWRYFEHPEWGHAPKDGEVGKLLKMLVDYCKKQKRDPYPKAIRHFAPRQDNNRCAWVQLTNFKDGAKLNVNKKRNTVQFDANGVQSVRCFFNEKSVKVKKKLTVLNRRRKIASVKLKPNKAAVLESLKTFYDPERIYTVVVDLKIG